MLVSSVAVGVLVPTGVNVAVTTHTHGVCVGPVITPALFSVW
jgi:hypothetical protein